MTTIKTRDESHVKVIPKVGTRHAQILAELAHHNGQTRAELHRSTGISEQSLCGRLNELSKAAKVTTGTPVYNPETDRMVVTYWGPSGGMSQ